MKNKNVISTPPIGKRKPILMRITLLTSLLVVGNTAPSLSSGNPAKIAEAIWDAGGHRRPSTWLGQDKHRSPSEWWNQGNHRDPVDFLMGVPSKNSPNAKK